MSRDVSAFEFLEQVGEGTYGQVWKARDSKTGDYVALKKVRMDNEREGFPLTAIREIKLLKTLHHRNIVNLKEIVTGREDKEKTRTGKGSIYMVFEYLDHDLTGLMDSKVVFTEGQIKCYARQLLLGLQHCHEREILHRDIKGSNLLINNDGLLKIADFGLARSYGEPGRKYTNRVITLWYRPPELLLGEQLYGAAVDLWSVGCLIAEMALRKPLFPGHNETEQLDLIFKVCGTPTQETWPNWDKLPSASMVNKRYPDVLRKTLTSEKTLMKETGKEMTHLPDILVDLLCGLLKLDPEKRFTAAQALAHPWFHTDPPATKPEDMPKYESMHEFQAKKKRQEAKKAADAGSSSKAAPK